MSNEKRAEATNNGGRRGEEKGTAGDPKDSITIMNFGTGRGGQSSHWGNFEREHVSKNTSR